MAPPCRKADKGCRTGMARGKLPRHTPFARQLSGHFQVFWCWLGSTTKTMVSPSTIGTYHHVHTIVLLTLRFVHFLALWEEDQSDWFNDIEIQRDQRGQCQCRSEWCFRMGHVYLCSSIKLKAPQSKCMEVQNHHGHILWTKNNEVSTECPGVVICGDQDTVVLRV